MGEDILRTTIFPYINFFIFLFAAIYFLKKPFANIATKRRDDYDRLVDEATREKKEAELKYNELKSRFDQLETEIASLKENTKIELEREHKVVLESANHIARHLDEEVKRMAEAEIQKAKTAIRKQMIAMASELATQKAQSEFGVSQKQNFAKVQIENVAHI